MQADSKEITHSTAFMDRWRAFLADGCGYTIRGGYAVLRDVRGRRVYSYLPLLNYSDKTSAVLAAELRELGARHYVGRALNPAIRMFCGNDPVTMRLALPPGGDPQALWNGSFTGKLRNQIRKSQKSGLRLEVSREPARSRDFYRLYRRRMHELGSPCLAPAVFERLPDFLEATCYVVYHGHAPAAGLVLVRDRPLAWVPWAASDRRHVSRCPNHLMYWQAIQDACGEGCKVFDFGRSPYLGDTYRFKQQWGAEPVKVDILQPQVEDPYSKYATAAAVWRRLPAVLVDRLGPVLCRHLPDL